MNERDELAEILYVEDNWTSTISEHDSNRLADEVYRERASKRWRAGKAGWAYHRKYPERADAILAAGYHKPRTIMTAGELRELPALAVVLYDDTENGGPFQTYVVPDDGTVMFAHRTGEFHFNDFGENYVDAMDMPLPVTVLWEPK